MTQVTVDELLQNGVHFGHRMSRWNPKMKPFIHSRRHTIHIIDLKETVRGLVRASHFLKAIASEGGRVLWVGTKRSAREAVRSVAARTGHPYVTERWLGGTLTNFETIRSRLARLQEMDQMETGGHIDTMSKKAQARFRTEKRKILKNLEGIRDLQGLPACLVVVDPRNEDIAVAEANKVQVPVVAILDTDCDPDLVDIAIPGNDDAMRSVRLLLDKLAEAVDEGAKQWGLVVAQREKEESERKKADDARREAQRQRDQVTEDWQRRLREEAEKRREAATTSGEAEPKVESQPESKPESKSEEKPEEKPGPALDLGDDKSGSDEDEV